MRSHGLKINTKAGRHCCRACDSIQAETLGEKVAGEQPIMSGGSHGATALGLLLMTSAVSLKRTINRPVAVFERELLTDNTLVS